MLEIQQIELTTNCFLRSSDSSLSHVMSFMHSSCVELSWQQWYSAFVYHGFAVGGAILAVREMKEG